MRKFLKFIKWSFFVLVGIIALALITIFVGHKFIYPIPYSSTPTVSDLRTDGICLGVGCHPQAKNAEDFIPVLANQIKIYNQVADTLWPGNQAVNMYAAVQSIENNDSWLISPTGEVKVLSKNELEELSPLRPKYDIGFAPFENEGKNGVYLALSEKSLTNFLEFQDYQFLGTYDMLITYSHEMFHILEQDGSWAKPDKITNQGRNPKLDNTEARIIRAQLIQQLMDAYVAEEKAEMDHKALKALAIYQKYKTEYPDDAEAGKYFDRIEGTAHYFTIVSSLYSAYPEQVYSEETLRKALKLLASGGVDKAYSSPGIDNESYIIGAWAGLLLDDLSEDPNAWKKEIAQNADITPMDLLINYYQDVALPDTVSPDETTRNEILQGIDDARNKKVAPGIFRLLYQLVF